MKSKTKKLLLFTMVLVLALVYWLWPRSLVEEMSWKITENDHGTCVKLAFKNHPYWHADI